MAPPFTPTERKTMEAYLEAYTKTQPTFGEHKKLKSGDYRIINRLTRNRSLVTPLDAEIFVTFIDEKPFTLHGVEAVKKNHMFQARFNCSPGTTTTDLNVVGVALSPETMLHTIIST